MFYVMLNEEAERRHVEIVQIVDRWLKEEGCWDP
jgi:hypothetical protein